MEGQKVIGNFEHAHEMQIEKIISSISSSRKHIKKSESAIRVFGK